MGSVSTPGGSGAPAFAGAAPGQSSGAGGGGGGCWPNMGWCACCCERPGPPLFCAGEVCILALMALGLAW